MRRLVRGLLAAALVVLLLVLTGCDQAVSPLSPLSGPSLVAVHATWCQPCQRDKPLLVEVAKEFPVTEIDFDSNRASQYRVSVLPTYIVMYEGNEILRTSNLRGSMAVRNKRKCRNCPESIAQVTPAIQHISLESEGARLWGNVLFGLDTCVSMIERYQGTDGSRSFRRCTRNRPNSRHFSHTK